MPWYNYYPRRRRWRRRWRGLRAPLRRRYWRRRWVRRPIIKKKLKRLKLTQWQPKSIRKCKVKGNICLFQTTNERLSNDFDLYELSDVPEHLPGGGGWGLKVYTLTALFSEHEYCRNIWTHSNRDLPLVRYVGCWLKLFQSHDTDYIFTYSNSLPMESNLGMYNAMQPSIQQLQQHHITVPSTITYKKKKPWIKIWIPPPTPLQNKWYFQHDLSKTPLLMTRVTACSLTQFYIDKYDINTNMNITTLNPNLFQNRNFANPGTEYIPKTAKKPGTQTESNVYLYASRDYYNSGIEVGSLIPLTDTKNYKEGQSFREVFRTETDWTTWKQKYTKYVGNPFYKDYLDNHTPVYQSFKSPVEIFSAASPKHKETELTTVELTKTIRYNPYNDDGHTNIAYFKSNNKPETGWLPPDDEKLTNEHLPWWLLLWGFCDFHRKVKLYKHLDTDWILTMRHQPNHIQREYLIPLSQDFIEGRSPYETQGPPLQADSISWYPQLQYQARIINDICRVGPGVAKLQDNTSAQAYMRYQFVFKFGGDPAKMSTIEDPREQPTFIIPGNQSTPTSLQHPETNPEKILWSFDERRHQITPAALKRLRKDETTEKTLVTGGSHFQEYTPTPEKETSEESSSEEETTTLLEQLQQQQQQHRLLKRRILKTLQKIQQLE